MEEEGDGNEKKRQKRNTDPENEIEKGITYLKKGQNRYRKLKTRVENTDEIVALQTKYVSETVCDFSSCYAFDKYRSLFIVCCFTDSISSNEPALKDVIDICHLVQLNHSEIVNMSIKIMAKINGAKQQSWHVLHDCWERKSNHFRNIPIILLVALGNTTVCCGQINKDDENLTEMKFSLAKGEVLMLRGDCPFADGQTGSNVSLLVIVLGTQNYSAANSIIYDIKSKRTREFSCSYVKSFCFVCHREAKLQCSECRCISYCSNECKYVHYSYHEEKCLSLKIHQYEFENYSYVAGTVPNHSIIDEENKTRECFGSQGKMRLQLDNSQLGCIIHCFAHIFPITSHIISRRFVSESSSKGRFISGYYQFLLDYWLKHDEEVPVDFLQNLCKDLLVMSLSNALF